MQHFIFLFALLSSSDDRLEKHQHAEQVLSGLHFFHNARGMHLAPDFINVYERLAKILGLSKLDQANVMLGDSLPAAQNDKRFGISPFRQRWGLVQHDGELKGFYKVREGDWDVGVLGCIACHSGKAAGQYFIGLGNKNIDVGMIGSDAVRAQEVWSLLSIFEDQDQTYKDLERRALDFAKRLSNRRVNNLTQGLVPISMVQQWFYSQVGEDLPSDSRRGQVKVPHFWGYGKKRFVGQFSDGFGDGAHAGWGLLVELVGGQNPQGVREMLPRIEAAEDLLGELLPPKFPFEINHSLATLGSQVFEGTCAHCHGSYERDEFGHPVFMEPKIIPIEVSKTDEDRLDAVTESFKALVHKNPLKEIVRLKDQTRGYFAPRLDGIWARFPYLHNGSVPSIRALLNHPDRRPKIFSMKDAGESYRFDSKNLGLVVDDLKSETGKELQARAKKGDRQVYDTTREGHSSKGHWYRFSGELSENEKDALIEYLKTL